VNANQNTSDAQLEYARLLRLCRDHINDISRAMNAHARAARHSPDKWEFAGDMNHIYKLLRKASEFLAG
jgi:hypothetical protein